MTKEWVFLGLCGCWGSFARVGTREAKEEHRKSQRKEVMSRNKGRHKQEKKQRHERQIAEGKDKKTANVDYTEAKGTIIRG